MPRFRRVARRGSVLGLALLVAGAAVAARAAAPAAADAGEGIYRRGVLLSGEPLVGNRAGAAPVEGMAAACINCHRRSGLGSKEGRIQVPPITGRFLFERGGARAGDSSLPFVEGARTDRQPYSEESLARAIREGVDAEGRSMNYLMPRYAFGDADLSALISYLRSLDPRRVPGLSGAELHLATIITPDADPVKRRGMLDVLNKFIADRNGAQRRAPGELLPSGKTTYAKMMLRLSRRWQLHVWELEGPESTWESQLEQKLAAEPVFAVVSGLAGRTWAPVQAFCEHASLPCLFPNVEAPPPGAEQSFYTLYLSRGVLLEADLIAAGILGPEPVSSGTTAATQVRQVFRAGDVGEAAAEELASKLKARGVAVANHVVTRAGPGGVTDALRNLPGSAVLVLWLRPDDLKALPAEPPRSVYLSGLMGGLERAPLPAGWRGHAHMAYPVDLPDRRRVRVDFALGWFRIRNIPVVAEKVQADTYLVGGLLSETMKNMIDAIFRDYLIERIEADLEHRIVTGYYPRLSLASGQRFASKGGYLVHFAAEQGSALTAEHDWRVP